MPPFVHYFRGALRKLHYRVLFFSHLRRPRAVSRDMTKEWRPELGSTRVYTGAVNSRWSKILGRCFVGLPRITARGRPRMFFSKRNTYIFVFFSGIPYHLHITTGDVRNASTNAKVYVILHGGEGEDNSGKLWLQNDKKDNFQRGRTDIFIVETTKMLSPLHHLTVGHDNSGLGAGWYCEKVKLVLKK